MSHQAKTVSAVPSASAVSTRLQDLCDNITQVILGKPEAIELAVITLLSDGHMLIEDLPGVGKTILARTIAISIGGSFNRIQFTPDLLPSDVTGVSVFDQHEGSFEFQPGPVFANVVLADEINRATPRTQSSLLESMSERQVTVDGVTHGLPKPHLVIATQNPIEYEGTYRLPAAQLDRFFARIKLGYPSVEEEVKILEAQRTHHPIEDLTPWGDMKELLEIQHLVHEVRVEESVVEYICKLVRQTRVRSSIRVPASPRASIALYRGSQARALLHDRNFVVPDDVQSLFIPLLSHRVRPHTQAIDDAPDLEDVLRGILEHEPVPV